MALHEKIRSLTQRFLGLTRREQFLLLAMLAVLCVAIFLLIHLQIARKAQTIQERTTDKRMKLKQIEKLTDNYYLGKKRREHFERKLAEPPLGLTSHVEKAATQAKIEISSITPRTPIEGEKMLERSVELTLTDVALERLVDFLKACETGPGIVFIKQLRIEKRPQNLLTCWITVATYSKKT
ncbi:MAG: type II secretion system protein M [Cystobacterineae bacterium]|nr:type II secretion system protein M [Cystobacterineae bacterium]